MIVIGHTNAFDKQFEKLDSKLQEEAIEKIDLFRDSANHKLLKVHKLHGKFKKYFSFSVNYAYRILFSWVGKEKAILVAIGNHKIYDRWI